MTFGGNIKQRLFMWMAVLCLLLAPVFAMTYSLDGDLVFRAICAILTACGVFFGIAARVAGLPKSTTTDLG